MRFTKKLIFLLSLVASKNVLADVASVSISYTPHPLNGNVKMAKVHVTSDEDLLEIEDIIVNRNNCIIQPTVDDLFNGRTTASKKKTLKYGQTVRYDFGSCNVREVVLETNYGTQTFNVNE